MYNKPGVAQSMTRLLTAMQDGQARTVTELVQLTGVHFETIRHLLRHPRFVKAQAKGEGKRWAYTYKLREVVK